MADGQLQAELTLGACFATASRLADDHQDLHYAEGIVAADGVPFAFDHAWCVSAASDRVVEPTLPDGMSLSRSYLFDL
jgi:hypothetical protein